MISNSSVSALLVLAARLRLHRRAAGVGLHAAAPPARAAGAVALDHHVADLAGGAAAEPGLAVEDQPAADAGAPEDAEQRVVGLAPAPSSNSASVATWTSLPIRTSVPERLRQRLAEREAALPAGQVAGAGDDAGLLVGVAGRADADAGQLARSRRRRREAASRSASSIASATSGGPARGRRRAGALRRRPCPPASTIAAWIFVPPRSMPPRRSAHARPVYVRSALGSYARERASGLATVVGEAALV